MERQQLLDELFALHRFGIKPGLERTRRLCEAAGNPERAFAALHIVGTNGKGATSALAASALQEAGYAVGLYSSPHILDFNERIRVRGVPIADEELLALADELLPAARALGATFFETTTALAFRHFANAGVDAAVIETGLGGRFDSTNVLPPENTLISVVASVDYDHEEYLGSTLELIAAEKAGIFKRGAPALVAEPRAALRPVFETAAAAAQAPLRFLDDDCAVVGAEYSPDFSMTVELSAAFSAKLSGESSGERSAQSSALGAPLRLRLPFAGAHQARNALAAYAALRTMRGGFIVSDEAFGAGALRVRENAGFRARLELLRAAPPVLLDVAHNPAGTLALAEVLERCGWGGRRWNVVFAAMRDKNIPAMLRALAPATRELYAPALAEARAASPLDVRREAERLGVSARAFESVPEALSEAFRARAAERTPTLIVGSFYLAEEVLRRQEAIPQ